MVDCLIEKAYEPATSTLGVRATCLMDYLSDDVVDGGKEMFCLETKM